MLFLLWILRLMPQLEAQVIIGFLRKLKTVAEHRPPKQIEIIVTKK